jgi:4-hydroxy-tetrahydrodipicolinate synthase
MRAVKKRPSFAGLGVALVTPFSATHEVDESALRRLVRRQVEGGVDVLVPCGTTGEAATMSEAEQDRVIAVCVEEAGPATVLAGAGSNDTRRAIENSRRAATLGAHGVLSVGPYYNKPTAEGYYRHFAAIAEASPVPVVLYNVPGRTGGNIDAATLVRLAAVANVAGVKEASGNIAQVMDVLRDRPQGFLVLSGDDAVTLPYMALGAEGVVSVAANEAPSLMSDLVKACARGDFAAARSVHARLLPLMNLNFVESNPIPAKAALALLGLCEDHVRLPLVPAGSATRDRLRGALRALDLLS